MADGKTREPLDDARQGPWHDAPEPAQAPFGYRTVALEAKQPLVDDVFHNVAARYDLMNDAMSAGLHRAWKNGLVAMLRPPKGARPFAHLDVAGGTGDVAARVLAVAGPGARVTALDVNGGMLGVGAARADRRLAPAEHRRLAFVQGNAEALPFPDRSFDAYTVAFGIRNVPRRALALAEARRVLKRGGRFLCLEFAPVATPGLKALYDAYSFAVIPRLGRLLAGDAEPYRYLVESIRTFPTPDAFAAEVEDAGFARVTHRPLTGGVAVIHSGWAL